MLFNNVQNHHTKPQCKMLIATGSSLFPSLFLHLFPCPALAPFPAKEACRRISLLLLYVLFSIFSFGTKACYGLVLNFVLDQGSHRSKWNKVKSSLENDNAAFQLLITAYSARLGCRKFSSYFLLAAPF